MAYISQGLIKNPAKILSNNAYSANVKLGGQNGFIKHLDLLDASTPLVLRPATVVVASVPTVFKYIPDGPLMFKTVFESFVTNITGIDFSITLDTSPAVNGNDGQPLDAPTDAKRTPISPSIVLPEISGNPFWTIFGNWIKIIRHPDTQASSLAGLIGPNVKLPPHVVSSYACDLLVIQYDSTLQPENIVDGFFITNVFPKTTGNFGLQKEMGTNIRPERTIELTGIMQNNENTKIVAQNVATILAYHTLDPDIAPPVVGNTSDIMENSSLAREAADIRNWNVLGS